MTRRQREPAVGVVMAAFGPACACEPRKKGMHVDLCGASTDVQAMHAATWAEVRVGSRALEDERRIVRPRT